MDSCLGVAAAMGWDDLQGAGYFCFFADLSAYILLAHGASIVLDGLHHAR